MNWNARIPRCDGFRRRCTALAGLLALALSPACSDESLASSEEDSPSAAAQSIPWEALITHSQRISPTPDWDGSVNGMKTLWFPRGAKRGEGLFRNGSKQGPWCFWYENGQTRWEGNYEDDRVEGAERSWYANGALCYEGTSVDDRRHGRFRAWYDNGKTWWEGAYSRGVRQGEFRYWRRDGSCDEKISGRYVDGRRVSGLEQGIARATSMQ